MKMFDDETEPDFVNEQGTKWWKNENLTNYCQEKKLKNHVVWKITTKENYSTYVIVEGKNLLYESQSFEGICCHIDLLGLCLEK